MRISDWSSDVCSSDLIASLPCRCTRRLLRRAICVFDLPLQAGDGLGACPQVARERWITRGRAQSRHGGCTKALKQPARPDQTARSKAVRGSGAYNRHRTILRRLADIAQAAAESGGGEALKQIEIGRAHV